ncbi:thioredoxin-dependent thiol peroxidase [Cellulomonas sp. APG4]|uniref:thioredoxin-dependent thiol peroxidase n=1 Tax=Cellulomonas sp. APG4 TaxID=1538656 RepID=UPI00137B2524|nr:thioredoxin-dependent thiol peroxidase [Cellulomonas sp. APG4]NCT91605.1 thioredoxin-dependent thiol peroxidase [Cellulomonas sp. APG4]
MTRLAAGDLAPDFTLPTDDGGSLTLSELRGGRVVIFFFPAAMTPGCTTQACDFRDSLETLKASGYTVVGISPDPVEKLARFREEAGLTYRLASDVDRAVLTTYGAYGEKKLYGKVVEGVIRSTIVVGTDGTVELAQYNVRATGHVAKLLRDLRLV